MTKQVTIYKPKANSNTAKDSFWIIVIVLMILFGKKLLDLITDMFPKSESVGEAVNNQVHQNNLNSQIATVAGQPKGPKASFPAYKYSEIADNLFKILSARNMLNYYDSFQLRQQFYLLQNDLDWLLLQQAWGVRTLKIGMFQSRDYTLIQIGNNFDPADKSLLNKRFQEKNIKHIFTLG